MIVTLLIVAALAAKELPYQFTESELYQDGDSLRNGLQKFYLMMGKVQQQAKELEKLNQDNDGLVKLIVNGEKHINEIIKNKFVFFILSF